MLNVGHGDSIIVEHITAAGDHHFGVIDSNRRSVKVDPPALTFLRQRGVTHLSFVLLTHPHTDHFAGLSVILDAFSVDTFYSYPMARDMKRLKELGAKYLDAAMLAGNATITTHAQEFANLIVTADRKLKNHEMEWIVLEGPSQRVRPKEFQEVTISAQLPFKKVKGEYFNALDANRSDALESPRQNELSVALDLKYGDNRIALCGDATKIGWFDHERELRKSKERLSFSATKIPHHGSAEDCPDSVIDYLYEYPPIYAELVALISADGSRHHPAPSVLKALLDRSIKPYCTNLSTVCGGNIRQLVTTSAVSPDVARMLNFAGARQPGGVTLQPCQGNICLNIPQSGPMTVDRQFNNACAYRGDFNFIPQSA